MKYKVRLFQEKPSYAYPYDIYQVINTKTNKSVFQGSLSDCEAWIRLTKNNYM